MDDRIGLNKRRQDKDEASSVFLCRYKLMKFCFQNDCPYRSKYCPVTEHPEICKYARREKHT